MREALRPPRVASCVTDGCQDGVLVDTGRCVYHGFTLRETAGAEALVYVRNEAGVAIDVIPFAADQGVSDWYDFGKACDGNLVLDIDTGAVEGSIFYA